MDGDVKNISLIVNKRISLAEDVLRHLDMSVSTIKHVTDLSPIFIEKVPIFIEMYKEKMKKIMIEFVVCLKYIELGDDIFFPNEILWCVWNYITLEKYQMSYVQSNLTLFLKFHEEPKKIKFF